MRRGTRDIRFDVKKVPELVLLGSQIGARVVTGSRVDWDTLDGLHPVSLEPVHLAGVVGEKPHGADAQVEQDLGGDVVVALIGRETKPCIRFNGVEPFALLQVIRPKLGQQPDSAALLAAVENDAPPVLRDPRHRFTELVATVAQLATKAITREALAVESHEYRVTFVDC